MADTTGKSIAGLHGGLDCHGVRSKVQCSYRCGNAAMRTWQGRNNSFWVCLLDLPTSNLEAPGPQQYI